MMAGVGGNVVALVFAALVALPESNESQKTSSCQPTPQSLPEFTVAHPDASLLAKLEQPWPREALRHFTFNPVHLAEPPHDSCLLPVECTRT